MKKYVSIILTIVCFFAMSAVTLAAANPNVAVLAAGGTIASKGNGSLELTDYGISKELGIITPTSQSIEDRFIADNMHNPQKARSLLLLALTKTADVNEIQRIFDKYS